MSVRLIAEVRQRSADGLQSREVGFFEDNNLAGHAIEGLYRELWAIMARPDFVEDEWINAFYRESAISGSFDVWSTEAKNSLSPVFYTVEHRLFSNVPNPVMPAVYPIMFEGSAPIW